MRIVLLGLLLLVTAGCAAFSEDSGSSEAGVQVTAAFYPLQYAAERVAGEHADVVNLTQPGGEPHDLELTIRETAEIASADLVIHEDGFQPAVDEAVEQNAAGDVIDVASVVDLMDVEESHDDHAEHGDEGEEGHDHGDLDPHFWQDPLRMADLGDAIAEKLSDIDPDHADDYAANAEKLRADMETLDAAYADGLAGCERDTVVVSHDAFGYLEKYGLHLAAVAGLSPGAEPTPADLADLQELIRDEGVTTVFSERLGPELTKTLADDLDIDSEVLDPIEGLSDETEGEDYVSLMEENLGALRKANACP
jgi:zinc transport system substrate-binding protein